MAKTKISEFSSTPANNTDIDSINIAEGCAPSGINDAIRELMSQLKDFQTGAVGDSFNGPIGASTASTGAFTTLSASSTVSGTGFSTYLASPPAIGGTAAAAGAFTTLAASGAVTLSGGTANGVTYLNGSKVVTSGSALSYNGTRLLIGGVSAGTIALSIPAGDITSDVSSGAFAIGNYGDTSSELRLSTRGFTAFRTGATDGTNGTERMRLDSAGNLGLGVTPSAWSGWKALQINSGGAVIGGTDSSNPVVTIGVNYYYDGSDKYLVSSKYATKYWQESGKHIWFTAPTGTAGNAITFTQAMTLDASGNLGVGTSSPSFSGFGSATTGVQVTNANNAAFRLNGNAGGDFYLVSGSGQHWLYGTGSVPMVFATNSTERARIDSSGNLLVAKTSSSGSVNGCELKANGSILSTRTDSTNASTNMEVYSTGASAYRFYVGMGGTVYATSTTITAISDQRLKENIRDLDEGLATVMALKPRKFDWKTGKGQDIKNARGFIAQEFETVLPDMIETWRDPAPEGEEAYKAINANLIPTLVKAIQEQQALIQSLKARLDAANL